MRFTNKVVLITGASGGIGSATATAFAREGAAVVINYHGSGDKANTALREVEQLGGNGLVMQCDVSNPEQVDNMFQQIKHTYGRLDVLVNNAGIAIPGPVAKLSPADFCRVIDVNLIGTYNCCHYALDLLHQSKGSIVNISSINANISDPTLSSYAASKAGIEAFSRSLMKEEARHGVRVNVVQPGPTATEMQIGGWSEEQVARLASIIPLGRLGQPEDVAKAIVFLSSEDASYITGSVLAVCGGIFSNRQ